MLTILIHHQFSRNLVIERGKLYFICGILVYIKFDIFSEIFYSNVSSSRESSRAGTYSKKVTYEVGSTVLPSSIMKSSKQQIEPKSKGWSSKILNQNNVTRQRILSKLKIILKFFKDQEVETGEEIQKSEPEDIIQTIYYVW